MKIDGRFWQIRRPRPAHRAAACPPTQRVAVCSSAQGAVCSSAQGAVSCHQHIALPRRLFSLRSSRFGKPFSLFRLVACLDLDLHWGFSDVFFFSVVCSVFGGMVDREREKGRQCEASARRGNPPATTGRIPPAARRREGLTADDSGSATASGWGGDGDPSQV